MFEEELADYTGAPYAVAVNSCTNALFLALTYCRRSRSLPPLGHEDWSAQVPRRTYVGVLHAVLNAGFRAELTNLDWWGHYYLWPTPVLDSARHLERGMCLTWREFDSPLTALSFHSAKQLPLGRGGAVLTDNQEAAEWFRAARMDGRPPGAPIEATVFPGFHCPMPPDVAARGLDILSRWNDAGYSPPPLPHTDYPDLSLLDFSSSHQRASSQPEPRSPVETSSSVSAD